MGLRILLCGLVLALASSLAMAQAAAPGTAIVVAPPAVVPMVSSPIVTTPLVTTPSVRFESGPNGATIPVVYNSSVVTQTALPESANANANAPEVAANTPGDLNLGNVQSISDLYSSDSRSLGEIARSYKARGTAQNARVYTNADINRIRSQAGEGSSSANANPAGSMPASDQSAEQNAQPTTPQVPAPAPAQNQNPNQKPSPFSPKQ